MHFSEEQLPFSAMAWAVLAVFYGIYFSKMLAQRRRGIRTRQIGRRKEPAAHAVEVWMSIATLGVVAVQILSIVLDLSILPANARFTGFCIAMLGNLIFLLSVMCMRDSWRAGIPDTDKTKLITSGIYRFSRNPAFLGFDFMYFGMLFLYCNPLSAAFTVFAIWMLHLQILQEERYLSTAFGDAYATYCGQVRRYLGRK